MFGRSMRMIHLQELLALSVFEMQIGVTVGGVSGVVLDTSKWPFGSLQSDWGNSRAWETLGKPQSFAPCGPRNASCRQAIRSKGQWLKNEGFKDRFLFSPQWVILSHLHIFFFFFQPSGHQEAIAVCLHLQTQQTVNDTLCDMVHRPPVMSQACNTEPCPPRYV